jgi:hypothetical protein
MTDRKYRQRGYMERDGERQQQGGGERSQRPREKPEGPRGRGLGSPTASAWRCKVCGARQEIVGTVSVDATCSGCGGDLHTCSNCAHFDTSRPNECRKPVTVRVANKTRRNSCDLFAPATAQEFASDRSAASPTNDPRAAFDALFKKK